MLSRHWLRSILWILLASSSAGAQSPTIAQLGPQIGDRLPEFSGTDQFGRVQTLDSVVREQGAMIVFFRSADW
jgi:hypothetical protein